MENAIAILDRIRQSLGTLHIESTRPNLNTVLGCMQLCDQAIVELQQAMVQHKEKEKASNKEAE